MAVLFNLLTTKNKQLI